MTFPIQNFSILHPVEFHNCNYSVMRVARRLRVPAMHSRDILHQATQIRWFSRRSGGGGWSGRAITKWRPRVSKLGLKGLSDSHSNETAVKTARRKASGPNKGLLSWNIFLKERAVSCKPNRIKGKRKPAREKTLRIRKSYSLFLRVMFADGRCWSRWRWWWVRTSRANHSVTGYWGLSTKKPV
jgi:hypothetical protein